MGIYDVTALFETGDGFAATHPTVTPASRYGRCQRESRRGRCAKLKARWRDVVRWSRKGHRSAAAWSDRPKRTTWTAGGRPCDTAVLVQKVESSGEDKGDGDGEGDKQMKAIGSSFVRSGWAAATGQPMARWRRRCG
ncbi:unnamed protein product [Musa acuminata subsp. burmannicoides]